MKEKGLATEVVVVTIGAAVAQDVLRTAMAIGADRGILLTTPLATDLGGLEPLAVAKLLKKIIDKEQPNLVIMGKQSIDDDSNQTGQILSALMDWPQATFASKVELAETSAKVTREIDGGLETIEVSLPAIITTDLRLNEPRYAALPNIMKAKQKPLETIDAATLEVDATPRLKMIGLTDPPKRQGGIKVDSVDALIDKLKNEAKVI
jgi:electron transfer flavoprotein beta subunit